MNFVIDSEMSYCFIYDPKETMSSIGKHLFYTNSTFFAFINQRT